MKKLFWLSILALCITGSYFVSSYLQKPKLDRLGLVTSFSLTDHNGNSFDSNSMQGKVWVANFFFTSCPTICPATTGKLIKVYEQFGKDQEFGLVSITVDAQRDSPEGLRAFAKEKNIDLHSWTFLTGSKTELDKAILEGFRIGTKQDPNLHSDRLVLVDRQGEIRGYFKGTSDSSVKELREAIGSLL